MGVNHPRQICPVTHATSCSPPKVALDAEGRVILAIPSRPKGWERIIQGLKVALERFQAKFRFQSEHLGRGDFWSTDFGNSHGGGRKVRCSFKPMMQADTYFSEGSHGKSPLGIKSACVDRVYSRRICPGICTAC